MKPIDWVLLFSVISCVVAGCLWAVGLTTNSVMGWTIGQVIGVLIVAVVVHHLPKK